MRRLTIIGGSVLAALALAAPVSANSTEHFSDTDHLSIVLSCGVVEETDVRIDGTAFFAGDGSWLRDHIRFAYDATFTALDGSVVQYSTRQVLTIDASTISSRGQGTFVRAGGHGAVLLDVGRLVTDPSDGSAIFQSASVIPFDDPTGFERYDAAVCSLFE